MYEEFTVNDSRKQIKQYTVFIPISGITRVYFQNQLNTHINNVFVI